LVTQIIRYFVLRWNIEVTFEETRAHLGIETQRQWSDKAIARTTPLLMSLFSVVTLVAFSMHQTKALVSMETASWYYKKGELTFSDIIAIVRRSIWSNKYFSKSENQLDLDKYSKEKIDALIYHLTLAVKEPFETPAALAPQGERLWEKWLKSSRREIYPSFRSNFLN